MLVIYKDCNKMHGQQNIKLCNVGLIFKMAKNCTCLQCIK